MGVVYLRERHIGMNKGEEHIGGARREGDTLGGHGKEWGVGVS
jgi:hypothetical protein